MKVGLDSDLMSFSRPIARHRNSASVKPTGVTLPWSSTYQIKIRSKGAMIADAAPSTMSTTDETAALIGVVILAGMQDGNALTSVDAHRAMKA